MDRRLAAALLVAAFAAAAYPTLAAPPGLPTTRDITLEVTALPCTLVADGVCLAYNGRIPGPTLDVNLGDTLRVTLVNRIAETLPPGAPAHLAAASVSWHVHGTALAASMDGVAAHPGTQLAESVAPPGGSFTYTVRAAYAGAWHFHDHVLGPDGKEGVERGLFGGLIVRSGAAVRPDLVVDLHMLNAGPRVSAANVTDADGDGRRELELLVVGLGDIVWNVELRAPGGEVLGAVVAGPGLSGSILVEDAEVGAYAWRATGAGTKTGKVIVS